MIPTPRHWHSRPLFWFAAVALAALSAYSALQQITFIPGARSLSVAVAHLVLVRSKSFREAPGSDHLPIGGLRDRHRCLASPQSSLESKNCEILAAKQCSAAR